MSLEFFEAFSFEEIRHLLKTSFPAILVVGVDDLLDEHLMFVREAKEQFRVPVIFVVKNLVDAAMSSAFESGAIACLGVADALRTLIFLVDNVAADTLPATADRKTLGLPVSDRVTLLLPDHHITDGRHETRLSPIPGALWGGPLCQDTVS